MCKFMKKLWEIEYDFYKKIQYLCILKIEM